MSTVIACVSDIHAGSSVAVCPPSIALDDGGEYRASKAQLWLWEGWQTFWERAARVREREKADDFIQVWNGDLVDGIPHHSVQILSGNPNAQAAAFNECMAVPLALGPSGIYIVRGTEAHVGKSAAAEERIADGLRRDKRPIVSCPETGTASHWHARMLIEGLRLSFAHHGRVGTRPWTKPNVTLNLAAQIGMEHFNLDWPAPHLAVRSHMHQLVDTGSAHKVRVVQTPAWQLATAFVHRIAAESIADIGGIIIVIKDGRLEVEPVLFKPEVPKVWRSA